MWHFKAIALCLWPEDGPEGTPRFIWHRWAHDMLNAVCQHNYVAIAGPGGAGKTEFMAIWLIIQFLCDPQNTICLATSITIGVSRKKLWGKIVEFWTPCESLGMPGKLVDSLSIIRYIDQDGVATKGDLAGISLIVGEKRKEREAVGRIIGIHQERICFVADDLTELSEAVTEAAFYNLSKGTSWFQLIGIANPLSYYDPFGKFAAPVDGWESISVDDTEWKTARGICLHFDGMRNPRITDGDERLIWMDSKETINRELEIHGGKSASWWRMARGFWSPVGVVELIYTEVEIVGAKADQPAIWRNNDLTRVCFLDPSFTNGGDRTVCYFGTVGYNNEGWKTLQYDEYLIFHDDVTARDLTRTQQVIRWWRNECEVRGVIPRYAGFDSTAAGQVFGDMVDIMWSKETYKLNFSGKPSDKSVSAFDHTPCSQRYFNRVSELWYGPKEAMRTGQLKGLGPEVIQEICSRKKTDSKSDFLRIKVESKLEMKNHSDKSPDIADAAFGLYDLCCERLGLSSGAASRRQNPQAHTKPFKEIFAKYDAFADVRKKQYYQFNRLGL